MVKKIKLDFSKVEDRSGWNTKGMPEGLHGFKVESVEETQAQDKTDMLVFALRPTAAKYKNRLFPFYCKLQPNQYWKLRDLLVAAGIPVPKKALTVDPNKVVGKTVAGEVEDETGQYEGRSTINGIYSIDTLEDDAPDTDDSDDDEEYEGDEDEADDEADNDEDADDEGDDEDDELDEDELREELEGLGLPALRKRAKESDIDTAGLKKAELVEAIIEAELEADEDDEDEDEDLDDEELDDEELDDDEEDEEEEEEPVKPARRALASKKPAAKAPAKKAAAPAAAGRRVVKRR